MNGAESLIQTLVDSGVDVCFTNPGTSEMHFVAALDEIEGMRCVLCLFEGVVSGAALGYAAMAEKPASTLLHLGPGLGNALANIHNAKKGNLPMVNIVGDHATYHLEYDAPLTSDIAGIAGTVSHWVHSSATPADIARDAAEAVQQAGIGQIATLILPADVSWGDNPEGAAPAPAPATPAAVAADKLNEAAALLRADKDTVIMVGGRNLTRERGLQLGRLAEATGARVLTETFPSRVRRGAGTAQIERLPYLAELAIEELKSTEQLLLIGCASPVSFFAYPNVPSVLEPEGCTVFPLAGPNDDIDAAIEALLGEFDATGREVAVRPLEVPPAPTGALDANAAAQALAHHLPEDAIVVDEGVTTGLACFPFTANGRSHDWLNLPGGSIGFGLPAAVGAAIACPERKVICLEGDGSAMYTVQSLWTMARENLDITVLLFNNRKYSILELEFARTGARGGKPGPKAASSLDIGSPNMDFASMARGMGMEAIVATTADEFSDALATAMAFKGPFLIDARVPPLQLG
ncbi:acetolactate synthase large subunit [Parahaliea maris]|uniref:Acetolactate synthase large subunit n=1 Tax=Parahaliea maris TaxID=2716870 RepID=A0A5C9A4I9_9GAMM|nr:acetolactate synthase large subunit [Parahaliea maris]TXS95785.1 acetolactate synthase large subunit [Parahaliea maris]